MTMPPTRSCSACLSSGAYVNITANASMTIYSPTYFEADSESEPTLVNHETPDGSKPTSSGMCFVGPGGL